jgi:hypothetical protein
MRKQSSEKRREKWRGGERGGKNQRRSNEQDKAKRKKGNKTARGETHLEFGFSGVLAQRSHDSAEFLGGNGAITILVEQGEGFLEFSDLFFSQTWKRRRRAKK